MGRAAAMPENQSPASCPLLRDPLAAGAWTACCGRYFRPLAVQLTGDADLAEDALQESWRKVLGGIATFRGGPVACRWVRRIVVNSAADIRRQILRRREVGLAQSRETADPNADPETRASEQELLCVMHETVALLPAPYREVLELRFGQELSTRETARRLAITRSNTATRLERALRLLRRRFEIRTKHANQGASVDSSPQPPPHRPSSGSCRANGTSSGRARSRRRNAER